MNTNVGVFSTEGEMQIGPLEQHFVFLDGNGLGRQLLDHFGLPAERGYTSLGSVRVTVELLEAPSTGDTPDRPS